MQIRFYRLRFHFQAQGPVRFGTGMASNTLRGALGYTFRQVACRPECTEAKTCAVRETCPYARIFEPVSNGAGPSGLADPPRPFVFRAAHLDRRNFERGEAFHFDVHLFDRNPETVEYFRLCFAQLDRPGWGPLARMDRSDVALILEACPGRVDRLQVRFVTPMELKAGQQLAERPDFGVLVSRIRDRLSNLGALYGGGPLEMDFAAFGRRASAVRMTRCELGQEAVSRFSTRTKQTHSLGGFTGTAEYTGDLAEFVPFLTAAQFTGVGRQTTWGKGEIAVYVNTPDSGPVLSAKRPALAP